MTIRPLALVAWSLSYLLLFAVWAVAFTTCRGFPAGDRLGWSVVLVLFSLVVAAGAALTQPPDDADRPLLDGLLTWGIALGGQASAMAAIILATPLVLVLALLPLLGVRAGSSRIDGFGWGILVAICAAAVALLSSAVLVPVADALFGSSLSAAVVGANLRDASLRLVAGAMPTAIGMAAVHTVPPWNAGVPTALLRGLLVAAAMLAVLVSVALLACGS